jgi:hypothetical protein
MLDGASALNVASANIERQELPVHRNRMFTHYFLRGSSKLESPL